MDLIQSFRHWIKSMLIQRLGGVMPEAHRMALDEHNTKLRAEYGRICRETEHSLRLSHDVIESLNATITTLHEKLDTATGTGRWYAQEAFERSCEVELFQKVMLRLTIGKPVMVVLMPADVVLKKDLMLLDGMLMPVPTSVVGKIAGPFTLYVRRVV